MHLKKVNNVWHATYYDSNHRRRTISTGCGDRSEAIKMVNEAGIPELERAGLVGRLTTQTISRIMSGGKNLKVETTLKRFEEWMKSRGRSAMTISSAMSTLYQWVNDCDLALKHPSEITVADIGDWINNRKSTTKLSSRHVMLIRIRAYYKYLMINGLAAADVSQTVCIDYSMLTHTQKEKRARTPFTPEEVETILKHIKESRYKYNDNEFKDKVFWQFAVRCSYETGLRLGDICRLEWSCFVRPGRLAVWQSKTGKRITHDISASIQGMITEIPVIDSEKVFPEQSRLVQDEVRRTLLSQTFSRICKRCGIEGKSFHCLRHSAASNAANGTDDAKALVEQLVKTMGLEKAKQLLGHSSSKMTENYVHHNPAG